MNDGRREYVKAICKMGLLKGRGLEIGAGMCWLTSELSKLGIIKKVYAVNFSEYLLEAIAPRVIEYRNGNKSKIVRVIGDSNWLPFGNMNFDFVVADAALYHTTDLHHLLKEVRRVLKDGGIFIAIREPIIPWLRPWVKKRFGGIDKQYGITENIYSMKEWKDYFRRSGFELKVVPFMPRIGMMKWLLKLPLFSLLNNYVFPNYISLAKKS